MSRAIAFIGATLSIVAALVLLAWLVGRVFTDRYQWSQWLWWVPTPGMLPVLLLGFVGSLRRAARPGVRRRRIMFWAGCTSLLGIYFSVYEHRLLHRTPAEPSRDHALKFVHWNAQPARWIDVKPSIGEVVKLDGDITVLSNPGNLLQQDEAQAWIQSGLRPLYEWPFALITRIPVRTMRPVVFVEGIYVVLVELDTTERLGRPTVMYLVDLPSNPEIGRAAVAKRLRTMLDGLKLPPPDVVVGDFNLQRGSDSIEVAFPNMADAFDEGGHGYGASFHRVFPLWHIDHVLLSQNLRALRYDVIDPGISRHRTQVAWIAAIKR